MTFVFVVFFGGLGTLVGPEGTVAGGAVGSAIATGMCGVETLAEVNTAKAIIDQQAGKTIPKPNNAPPITVQVRPEPPQQDPPGEDKLGSGRGGGGPGSLYKIVAATLSVILGGTPLLVAINDLGEPAEVPDPRHPRNKAQVLAGPRAS